MKLTGLDDRIARWRDRLSPSPGGAMEDTAMPFPYPKIIAGAIGCKHRPVGRWRTRQCRFPTPKSSLARSALTLPGGAMEDTAMPFPYPKIIAGAIGSHP
ncbi:hypothetical protein, partial [Microcoleus sp. F10-B2]|uniref:hypothetical protein n=1 Tax=Microcoleus sp. F10-B2 TaxID=2818751 RepID=UPI002FD22A2E